jgi:hypothetical protein
MFPWTIVQEILFAPVVAQILSAVMTSTGFSVAHAAKKAAAPDSIARTKFNVAHLSTRAWTVSSLETPTSADVSTRDVVWSVSDFSTSFLLMGPITRRV